MKESQRLRDFGALVTDKRFRVVLVWRIVLASVHALAVAFAGLAGWRRGSR